MKAIYTLVAALMIVSTTFAQSSRRSETKENNTQEDKSVSVSSTRRSSSDNSSRRGDATTGNNRSTNSQATERRQETNSNNQVTQPSTSRSSGNSSRTSTQEPSRSSSGNQQSTSRTYEPNRRESSNDRREVVQDHSRRTVEPRHHTVVHKSYRPVPVEVRRVKYPYRAPVRAEVIWTVDLSHRFEVYYPHYRPMRYHVGMRLPSVSAYDAYDFVGEIARVYGRVAETYFAWETDEYFLYLGDYYPYHDFTVVVPGREARDFSRRPERYFDNQYIEVTGLISRFEGKPEMIIKRSTQVGVY